MASNKNIPHKSQGANEPDKNQPVQSDAADVDWMIISDISTRIGGYPENKSGTSQSAATTSSQVSNDQLSDNDIEDIEWLRSLGLDDAIDRSPSSKNTSNSSGSNATNNADEVGNIDWLIVTDLNTRMDNPRINVKDEPSYQNIGQPQTILQSDNIVDSLDDDLGLDGLDFLEGSDFSDLNSLGFDTSDSFNINEVQNEIENVEVKINGLAELLDDSDNSSFDLSNSKNDHEWDLISEILDDNFNQPSSEPILDTVNKSYEVSTQISDFLGAEEFSGNDDPIQDRLTETDYPEDLLVEDLELSDEAQFDQLVEDFENQDYLQNTVQGLSTTEEIDSLELETGHDLIFTEEVSSLDIAFGNETDNAFETVQPLDSLDSNVTEDEIWSSNSSNLESAIIDESVDNAFTNDWGQISENAIDDAVWGGDPSIDPDLMTSASIDNAFGEFDSWENASNMEQSALGEHSGFDLSNNVDPFESGFDLSSEQVFEQPFDEQPFELINNELEAGIENNEWSTGLESDEISHDMSWDASVEDEVIVNPSDNADWSASLEAEISIGNEAVWNEEFVEIEDYLQASNQLLETVDDDVLGLVESGSTEQSPNEGFDFSDNLDDENWAIANNVSDLNASNLSASISDYEDIDLEIPQAYDDFSDASLANLDNSEQILDQQQFTNFNDIGDQLDDDIASSLEVNEFSFSENIPPDSDWESFSESIVEQVTDSGFDDYTDNFAEEQFTDEGFTNYVDDFAADQLTDSGLVEDFDNGIVPPVNTGLGNPDWNANPPESFVAAGSNDDVSLESMLNDDFDLASFDEDSLLEVPDSDFNFANISTTLTPNRASSSENIDTGLTYHLSSINVEDGLANNIASQNDSFDEALVNDLLNDSYGEVNFQEEALAHNLLNDLASESDDFGLTNNSLIIPSPNTSSSNVNLASSTNSPLDSSNHDFLDEFDLDVIDPLIGESFDSGFGSAPISTGLTPPTPSIAPIPPSLPPLIDKQELTSPSINYLPPPPSLPPLPPKRVPTHGRPSATTPPFPVVNTGAQVQPQNRIGNRNEEDDFDQFHAQSDQQRNRKPMASIDEAWSDLLDADTVLSGGRASTGSSYSDMSNTMPPIAGVSAGRTSQGRENRERNSSGMPKRKETNLPDFNEIGLEIHDDNTDWSGLLDSSDLSDSITTISPQGRELPSRVRSNPIASRSDSTNVSETREIPRDRRNPMPSFGDSTQARMGTTSDQIDFNRFTEDNYGDYNHSLEQSPSAPSSKPKLTLPTITLESLWNNYLKIPAIGLGAIGGAFLLYSLLNRPIFDLGLRWGLFKDASGKDFTNVDFKGAKLDNVDFSKAILTGAKMQDASLVGANFKEANINGVNFTKANLSRARLIQASVIWADFNSAQMNLVDLAGADLTRSNFVGAKMEGANLKNSKIGAQGTEEATKFSATTLLAWQIVNEPREGRNLSSQDLSGLNLSFTSLKRANLSNVKLNYTDMTNTDLSGANLSRGQVNGTNWSGAKLNGINLTGVAFDKSKLPKTDEKTVCPNGTKGPCKF